MIKGLLRLGPVRFVVADLGHDLHWCPETDCFRFWREEVRIHLVEPGDCTSLDQFPGEYAYFASRWEDGGKPVLLLSKSH